MKRKHVILTGIIFAISSYPSFASPPLICHKNGSLINCKIKTGRPIGLYYFSADCLTSSPRLGSYPSGSSIVIKSKFKQCEAERISFTVSEASDPNVTQIFSFRFGEALHEKGD